MRWMVKAGLVGAVVAGLSLWAVTAASAEEGSPDKLASFGLSSKGPQKSADQADRLLDVTRTGAQQPGVKVDPPVPANQKYRAPARIGAKLYDLGLHKKDALPEEAKEGIRGDVLYSVDDGTHEDSVGLTAGGTLGWMNHFQTVAGAETITTISVGYGLVGNGTAVTVYLWSDPNQDGNPTDGQVLASAATVVANSDLDVFNAVDIPDTAVGPAGTHFFVGAIITHLGGEFPCAIDQGASQGESWIAGGSGPLDPNNMGAAEIPPGVIDSFGLPGNWLVRAEGNPGGPPDCNDNGIPDPDEIAGGTATDCNNNGTPDDCETDCDGNGTADSCDIAANPGLDIRGGGPTCNQPDGILDSCQDCNANGTSDRCELNATNDCDGDGILDECQPTEDCNGNGTSDACELGNAQVSYNIPVSPPAPIPDFGAGTHTFNVPAGGTISDVNVDINISHTWVSDLAITVEHLGVTVNVFNHQCAGEDNFTGTIFDDEAAGPIACVAGHVGTFRPFSPLSAFDGLDAAGPWTITAADNVGADTGSLNGWSLHISMSNPNDCNGNQTPDECELATNDCDGNGTLDDCELEGNDCNENGVPDQCDLTGGLTTYDHVIPVSPALPVSNTLPPAVHSFTATETGPISDVDVGITMTHTWSSDVEIRVTHGGTTVVLFDNQCGSEDNFNGTLWDDEAAGPIACVANHPGVYRPFSPLAAFDGMEASGPWTISVTDNVSGDSGSLTAWRVRVSAPGTNDCDGNGIPDECDEDCNGNGRPDGCDILDGTSEDCQPDGIPDECQIGRAIGRGDVSYQVDDGSAENGIGLTAGGSVAWMNHFVTVDGAETITTILIAYDGTASAGTPVTAYLWSDPNQDGDPTDGQVLAQAATAVADQGTNTFVEVDIPDTAVGPAGTHFFVGGIIQHAAGEFPCAIDEGASQGQSWIAGSSGAPVDPNNMGASELPPGIIDSFGLPGNWLIRAEGGAGGGGDCNSNGIPDDCDIADGTSQDCNGNGRPDECEFVDCDNDGLFDECEIAANPALDLGGGEGPADCDEPDGVLDACQDCNNNGTVDCADLLPGTGGTSTVPVAANTPIPDCNGTTDQPITSTKNVSAADAPCVSVEDVDVGVRINHTWVGDLVVTLTSPGGSTVTLMHRVGANNPNPCSAGGGGPFGNDTDNVNVIFDDAAALPIESQLTTINTGGSFRPSAAPGETANPTALSTFNGQPVCGNWTLTVRDDAGGDLGTLVSWDLRFRQGGEVPPFSEDCNGTGIPDECELSGGNVANDYVIPVAPPAAVSNTVPPAVRTFEVSATGPIADVDVGMTMTHTWVSDVVITLSHGGTTVTLFNHQCGSEDNFNGTVWDDEAAGPIACVAGHVGTFRPFNALSAFDGMEASGTWTMTVADTVSGDAGSWSAWFLRVTAPGSNDCDNNGAPDECDPDCNANGDPDACDIASGFSEDCNGDGVPDECEPDCNDNGFADGCDIANGTSDDCNKDGTPDECFGTEGGVKNYDITANIPINDVATQSHTFTVTDSGTIRDVNVNIDLSHTWIGDLLIVVEHNGVEVALWDSQCGNTDNMNVTFDDEGLADAACTDIPAGGLSLITADEIFNGGPGLAAFDGMDKAGDWTVTITDQVGGDFGTFNTWRLEIDNEGTGGVGLIDCNSNGLLDECDILFGLSTDCNDNGTPDECEPGEADCNNNGTNDLCDIDSGFSTDLNLDEIPDDCQDCNGNGTPDFFDVLPTNIKFYSKNFNPPANIPDCNDAGVVSVVNVGEFGPAVDVDVAIAIDHTNNGDLYVTLSHGAVTVPLIVRPGLAETNPLCAGGQTGGSDDDGLDVMLNDEALSGIEGADSGGGVLLGSFRPNGLLSAFDGMNKFGAWTLTVRDGASGNTGMLVSWQLRLANNDPFSEDCNQNGTPDECESGGADCNNNGIFDACELGGNDCNDDGTPDDCQLDPDCNNNGIPDNCDLDGNDCDGNGVPDECELAGNDCNENGTPDQCDLGGGTTTASYNIPVNPPVAIPDANPTGGSTSFNVPVGGTIQDVNVDITISHTWVSDLEIRVTHGGTTVILFDNQCGSEDNFTGTIFDDEAGSPIACVAGHVGTFTPAFPLSAFDGMDAAGAWTLTAVDSVGADVGAISNWSLHFVTGSAGNDCDGNGVPDECDPDCQPNGTPDACELGGGNVENNYPIPVNPPQAIPDNNPAGTSHTFNVPTGGAIQDVDVDLTATHTWVSDLEITVTHGGTSVILFNNQCGSEDNFTNTVWDDEAAGPIACVAGHSGTFRPFSPLSAFDGMDAAGPWTISLVDSVGADVGNLIAWSLSIEVPNNAGDCNGNGTPDECEADCDEDGTPDDCEVGDCDEDGIPDDCEVDCQPNGTPDECEEITPPTEKIFEQNLNLPIPNNFPAGVSTIIDVPVHGVIGDVNVLLFIDHQEQGDLRVTLTHNNVPVRLINRAGSNASGCGISIYGYPADDYGNVGAPLVLDDSAGIGIDCYDGGPLTPLITGEFNYAGPAQPSQPLSAYNGMDKFGEWKLTVSDHLFYNSGALKYWALEFVNQGQGDCNDNGIPDECDIDSGYSTDANANGIPDECEIAVVPAVIVDAASRKSCELGLFPRSSEPRLDGVDFVDITFDQAVQTCDTVLEWAPCSGGDFAAYTGSSTRNCFTVGEHLYMSFSPGLENFRRYRIRVGEGTTTVANQAVEFRTLLGDVNRDGSVNALDRSLIVGIWTGAGFSCETDIDDDSMTNATDRSSVVGVWTSGQNTCPW